MLGNKLVKRIITCQGTIQLVTALSVLSYREKEQQDKSYKYENYLVIYDLFSPPEQIDAFAAFIGKMARVVCNWQAIIYLSPKQTEKIAQQLKYASYTAIFEEVYELVGIDSAEEIYLSRNWQFGNQLLINAYQSAEKICYGDGVGLYFSSNSTALFPSSWQYYLKKKIINTLDRFREKLQLKKFLKTIEFDIGYFLLPDVTGELPPMKTILLDKKVFLETFQKLSGLVDTKYLSNFRDRVGENPVWILLTSNFSEAKRMSLKHEIAAYRQFLISEGIKKNTVLVIKPHPRDSKSKIENLAANLSDLFTEVLVLSGTNLFFLPFEIFFTEAFVREDLTLTNQIKVFAVSSACLSLKLLYNLPSIVGFGEQLTPQFFHRDYIAGRLDHELELKLAVEKIEGALIVRNIG
jgi:hypothetical protein